MKKSDQWLAEATDDLKASILFLTRLPFARGAVVTETDDLAHAVWAFPVAGALIGIIGAVVYALAVRAGLPPWPSAVLAVAVTLLATGCLHEDGLADTVDGFGGGETRQRKLEIMRDSRIGTYGVCAVTLSIVIRTAALAALAEPRAVMWALLASHAAARATMAAFMYFVPPARQDGLSFVAGRPSYERAAVAAILGFVLLIAGIGFGRSVAALVLLAIVMAVMAWLSVVEIDGQTGDVLGAVEQISEIAVLLVALG